MVFALSISYIGPMWISRKDALTVLLLKEHLMNGIFDPRSNDPIDQTVAELTEITNLDLSKAQVLTTECADGTHNCITDALCIQVMPWKFLEIMTQNLCIINYDSHQFQSTKTAGYFCECPNGRLGNGFKTEFGGDGCSETCEMFKLDCSNDHLKINFNPGLISQSLGYKTYSSYVMDCSKSS